MPFLNLKLRVWRQPGPNAPGRFVEYDEVPRSVLEFVETAMRH